MKNTADMLDKGSIFLTEFPFTDLHRSKIRPVVVLHHDASYDDVIVAAISSSNYRRVSHSAISINAVDDGFTETGLKKNSIILSHRIITLNVKRLFYRLGKLPLRILEALDTKLLENFKIGLTPSLKSTAPYIPYGKQTIDENDIFSVVKTIRSDYLTQGPAVPVFEAKVRVSKKTFEIYSVFGTVQYSPKGMGHTAEGHQPIEQDGVMVTGENNAINISLRWSCQRDRALGLLICRAYRRYQPHRGVMSIAKIKKQNQLQRSAMPIV